MEEPTRKTGINVLGEVPWGTHGCLFYQTKDDLMDILVPYFKAGLENNEFCMWVTSEPLSAKEVQEAMREGGPDFDAYLQKGQIELLPYTQWYLKDGAFDLQSVLHAWMGKLDQALTEGYEGMRVTGNTAWLEKGEWRKFAEYEKQVNNVIADYRMLAICTYALDQCGASEVIDVASTHPFALIRREGTWECIESTERKRAQEVQQESQERYRALFEQAPDSIVLVDAETGALVEFNDRAHESLGYTRQEFEKLKIPDFEVIESAEEVAKHIEKVIKEGADTFETKHRTKGGEIRDILVSTRAISIRGRDFCQSIWQDITEHKKAREAVTYKRYLLDTLMDNIPDAIYFKDVDSRFIQVNRAKANKHGLSDPAQAVGKTDFDFFTEEHAQQAYADEQEVMRSGQPVVGIEEKETWPDGRETWVSTTKMPLRDEKGNLIGTFGISRNITDRKRMEEALRESEENFRSIFQSVPESLLTMNKQMEVLKFNKAFEELLRKYAPMLNMSEDELRKRIVSELRKHLRRGQRGIIEIRTPSVGRGS